MALAEAAIRSGLGAYFITAHDLATDLGRVYREGRLDRQMRIYLTPKVLVIDEVGYLPLDDLGTTVFFQLVSARYQRGSIILTSNKSYGDWGSPSTFVARVTGWKAAQGRVGATGRTRGGGGRG